MFWGEIIQANKPHKVTESEIDTLRVSNIALGSDAKGPVSLFIKAGNSHEILICTLIKGKSEHTVVDLYFNISRGITLTAKGPGSIHVSGYYDPSHEDFAAEMGDEDEDEFQALQNA